MNVRHSTTLPLFKVFEYCSYNMDMGKHQKAMSLGALAPSALGAIAPEGDHFDFKPQKGVTLLISHKPTRGVKGAHCIYLPEGTRIY